MNDEWAQARMWAWDTLQGWGTRDADGTRHAWGLVDRLDRAEKLAQWVMCGPHPAGEGDPEPDGSAPKGAEA